MSLLITNGRVITAADDYVADVYCINGVITAIGQNLPGGLTVSRADVAHLMLRVLDQPETIKQTVGIAS